MDSIPWEKAQLAAEEKPHCVLGKKPSGHFDHPDGEKNIALRAG